VESRGEAFYLNNKGYILLLKKEYDNALSFIDNSIGIDPSNGWAYRNKGIYYYETGNIPEAIRLLRQAEAIDPLIDELYSWLGEAYLRAGEKTVGCDYLAKALAAGQTSMDEVKTRCP
jgi:tetratricopeptide (TPR) repeat protein